MSEQLLDDDIKCAHVWMAVIDLEFESLSNCKQTKKLVYVI